MCSAVTLSRSPPRADTTMMATGERSRIWRQSSNPSASGSIRSSSTMSGSSVSSSWSARMPSTLTTGSKPRTARLDRIRSTMLGSSSTTSAQVLRAPSVIAVIGLFLRARRRYVLLGLVSGLVPGLDRQRHPEAGALLLHSQPEPATVRLHDALRDGQAQARAGARAGARAAGGLERRGGQLRRQAKPVVQHADDDLGRPGLGAHPHPGSRRVVAERDRKSTRLNSSHLVSRMPSSA